MTAASFAILRNGAMVFAVRSGLSVLLIGKHPEVIAYFEHDADAPEVRRDVVKLVVRELRDASVSLAPLSVVARVVRDGHGASMMSLLRGVVGQQLQMVMEDMPPAADRSWYRAEVKRFLLAMQSALAELEG
jgi:hypothetical protein